jgi:phospholipid/cholesterol/gamma-HCH transport system substrate-binding protein
VLDVQGLTGVAFVQIEGGYRGQPPITALAGQDIPVIPARPSAIQSLFQNAPQLLEQVSLAVNRINLLLNEPNRRALGNTLANLDKISSGVARRTPEIERSLVELEATVKDLRLAANSFSALAQSVQGSVANELPPILAQTRSVLERTDKLMLKLDSTVSAAQPGVTQFSDVTVPELNRLLVDVRALTRSLQLAAEKFEGGPAQALFGGDKVPEYVPQSKN